MFAYETAECPRRLRWPAIRSRYAAATIAVFVLAACCLLTPAAAQQASEPPPATLAVSAKPSPAPRPSARAAGYYIEFRTGQIGLYGHSYAAFGRLDARGNPVSAEYTDLHPMGNYGVMALGHFVPVPANTEWNPDVLKLPIVHRYRRSLTAEQYKSLTAKVEQLKNKTRIWNAVTYNCNHYIGELAESVGLKVPMQFHLSYGFVEDLQTINETKSPQPATAERKPERKPKRKPVNAAAAATPAPAATATTGNAPQR
jgi:hypothetical protein